VTRLESEQRRLLAIALGGLVIRAWVVWRAAADGANLWAPDAPHYEALATSLLTKHTFQYQGAYEALRTPGYPAFMAALYGTFGHHPTVVLAFQALLSCLALWPFWAGARAMIGGRGALWATAVLAFDPGFVLVAGKLWSEAVTAVLVVAALLAHGLVPGSRRPGALGLGEGVVWGLSILVRPGNALLAALAALHHVAVLRPRRGRALAVSGGLLLTALLVLSPWVVRNYRLFGRASLSTIGPHTLALATVPQVESRRTGAPISEVRREVQRQLPEEGSPFALAEAKSRLALRYIRAHPVYYVGDHLKTSVMTLAGPMASHWEAVMPGAQANRWGEGESVPRAGRLFCQGLLRGIALLTLALAVVGVVVLVRQGRTLLALWLVLSIAAVIVPAAPQVFGRFRVTVMPYLALLAGAAMAGSRRGDPASFANGGRATHDAGVGVAR
jgi:4-amino-4-deoxy-L-arabinose transferase-like glycosyltransferase